MRHVTITPKVTRRDSGAWEKSATGWAMEISGDLNDAGRLISVLRLSGANINPDSIKKIDDQRYEFVISEAA